MKKRQLTHAFNKEAGFTTNPTLSPPFNRDADQKGQKTTIYFHLFTRN